MHIPAQFREERPEILAAAIRDIQLATLVTATPDGYHASHLPMILKESADGMVLEGHLARAGEHWRALAGGAASLAVFQGPQSYVSPSWYETKRQHGKVVPTWNYVAVHAHGRLEAVEDGGWLAAHLDELTELNEASRPAPWAVSDAPDGFIQNLSRAIVGIRMPVERLEGSWKMIQHRSDGDRLGTLAGLAEGGPGQQAVAAVMRDLEAMRSSQPSGAR